MVMQTIKVRTEPPWGYRGPWTPPGTISPLASLCLCLAAWPALDPHALRPSVQPHGAAEAGPGPTHLPPGLVLRPYPAPRLNTATPGGTPATPSC